MTPLPCPFCGKPPRAMTLGKGKPNESYWIECLTLPCVKPKVGHSTRDEALAIWNTRAQSEQPK